MNREIKFRIGNIYKGKYTFVGYEAVIDFEWKHIRFSERWIWGTFEFRNTNPDIEIVRQQFTGLKDKNGKEIYEGDVLKDRYGHILKVIYSPCSFIAVDPDSGLQMEGSELEANIKDYDSIKGEFSIEDKRDDLEIIGNVYENKELLK